MPPPAASAKSFDILLRGGDDPATKQWWDAPYLRDLPFTDGVGWTDGDRAGYRCAYMFLFRNDDPNDIVGRVTFIRTDEASGYASVNDRYMGEGYRFFDGTVSTTDERELGDCPDPSQDYVPYNGPDERAEIYYVEDGNLYEDRSYTNTTGNAIEAGALKFQTAERITQPFQVESGLGNIETVYSRVTILAHFNQGDGAGFQPGIVVYYDSLDPNVELLADFPGRGPSATTTPTAEPTSPRDQRRQQPL